MLRKRETSEMQSFYEFFLKIETEMFYSNEEGWFVFDESHSNEIKVFVKFRNPYILEKGHYFKATRPTNARYLITDKGNVDFFTKGVFVRIDDERVLSEYDNEEDAIQASESAFKGFIDPEGDHFRDIYADRLDDIGLPHK